MKQHMQQRHSRRCRSLKKRIIDGEGSVKKNCLEASPNRKAPSQVLAKIHPHPLIAPLRIVITAALLVAGNFVT